MGLELGEIKIKHFVDGEIYVQDEESVRGCDVYLVQPTCPPANENPMELLIMIDACRRASAKNITVVIPYFGYARADRKCKGGKPRAADYNGPSSRCSVDSVPRLMRHYVILLLVWGTMWMSALPEGACLRWLMHWRDCRKKTSLMLQFCWPTTRKKFSYYTGCLTKRSKDLLQECYKVVVNRSSTRSSG